MNDGWIKLHRALLDSSVWDLGPDITRLVNYLLLKAKSSAKAKKFFGTTVKRGEVITSLADIASDCSWYENRKRREWSRQKVMRMLDRLQEIEFCNLISDTFGTHISICNYNDYQLNGKDNSDNSGTTVEQQRNNSVHIQEGKEREESKEEGSPLLSPILGSDFTKWTSEQFM